LGCVLGYRSGDGVGSVAGEHFVEFVGSDADGGAGAGKGEAVGAGGFAIDELEDAGERCVENGKDLFEGQCSELFDPAIHLLLKEFVLLAGAATAVRLVSEAEFFSAFGDAAAGAAVGIDVGTFLDARGSVFRHTKIPPKREKPPRGGFLF
jgi:hypothetical protein